MAVQSLLALVALVSVVHATTLKFMVPMRDGVELSTYVDFLEAETPTNKTVVIERSPYGHTGTELIADIYLTLGCVAVRQDIRGSHDSQGNFSLWRTEDLDVYDTLKWIGEQSWSNGKVYTVGASADGMATFTPMMYPPPHLKGQFFIFSTANGYPIVYPGGAYRYALANFWMSHTFPSQAPELLKTIEANEAPGVWWNPLNATGHFANVSWPSVHYAGWYDIFLVGHLTAFQGMQYESAPEVRGKSRIVVDPLGHCQSAAKYFERNTILGRVALAFLLSFDLVLEESHAAENVSAVTFYVMGSNENAQTAGQFWVTVPEWPTPQPTRYYFHSDLSLSTTAPSAAEPASTSYLFDPANPQPTIGGSNLELKCGPLDQTPTLSRPDVVSFTTAPLSAPLALTGALNVKLYVSSNATDTDFTAKVMDVYPSGVAGGGESRLLNDGIVRMRWRNLANAITPEPMVPGTVYEITISLWNTSYIFTEGHSIRVAVSSSNWERFSVNPNTGVPLNVNGTAVYAHNTLYHSAQYASYLELPVVQMSQLPEFHPLDALKNAGAADARVGAAVEMLMRDDEESLQRFNSLLLGGGI